LSVDCWRNRERLVVRDNIDLWSYKGYSADSPPIERQASIGCSSTNNISSRIEQTLRMKF
jgi:hypothetical protein